MYYFLLFLGVFSFLSLLAWRDRGPVFLAAAGPARQEAGLGALVVGAGGSTLAGLLQGRREEKSCVTPIDCVRTGRCAGHCGFR